MFSLIECPESTKRCFYPRTTRFFVHSSFDWELPAFGRQVAFVAGAASPPGLCIALGRLRRCQGTVHHRDMDFGSDPRQQPLGVRCLLNENEKRTFREVCCAVYFSLREGAFFS